MKNQFFEDIIGLAPQQMIDHTTGAMSWGDFADKESVDSAGSNIESEVIAFRSYLEERQPQDRVRILEYTTGELLTAYYTVRRAMKGLTNTEKDEGRPSMGVIYMAIAFLMTCAERDLELKYRKEFVVSWVSRGDYILAPMLEKIEKRENAIKEADALAKELGISQTLMEPDTVLSEEMRQLLQKAVNASLVSIENDKYKWNSTKQLLAYLAEKSSLSFSLGKKRVGSPVVNWKLFEGLFGCQNLKSAKNDWMKIYTTFTPTGFEEVDKLFD